jgi:AcrR family transcriptional regulator
VAHTVVTRREQAESSRAGLVEAARQSFTERGYESTTVAAILERAGMARGALYHYFPGGKQEIFHAVFASINDEFHRRRDAFAVLESPMERIRAGMRVFLDLCTDDDFARIALVDAPRVVPGQAERGSSYTLLRDQLGEAIAIGEVGAFDVDAMAMALYGAVRSAGELVLTATDRDQAATIASESLALLLDGLRIRPR